jgi:hypothetical protein
MIKTRRRRRRRRKSDLKLRTWQTLSLKMNYAR